MIYYALGFRRLFCKFKYATIHKTLSFLLFASVWMYQSITYQIIYENCQYKSFVTGLTIVDQKRKYFRRDKCLYVTQQKYLYSKLYSYKENRWLDVTRTTFYIVYYNESDNNLILIQPDPDLYRKLGCIKSQYHFLYRILIKNYF